MILELTALASRTDVPGLTQARIEDRAEAASVCLSENGHEGECQFKVRDLDSLEHRIAASLIPVTQQMRQAHADLQEATEHGAEAIAFVLSLTFTPYTIVGRSRKGTGFDYWLGVRPLDFAARLEISGILRGTRRDIEARIREKRRQIAKADELQLPAYICVVEFSIPSASLVQQ